MRKAARNAEPEVPTAEWENLGTNDAAATQALLSLSKVAFQPDEDLESVDMIAMLEEELDETYRGVTQLTNELEQARKHLEKLSFYDDLTGLANRALFYDRLEQGCELAKREGRLLPILMMDLDRFKEINDTMGHDIGDQVLQEVAKRLKETLRHSDTVARLGGDEFAALLPSALEQEGVDIVVQKLVDAVGKPIAVGGEMVDVGISIGVALYPVHGEDGVITLSNADAAMYSAKKDGCGFIIYGSDGTAEEIQKSTLASQLRAGISKNQLFLEYQPKINLVTGEVAGVEALVRWKHPEFGLISPAEFIPAAERTGVIKPLTLNVMEQAMEQAVIWQRAENPLNLSVNVSARLLNDWELPDLIIRLLEQKSFPPENLIIEITETAFMKNPEQALRVLERIQQMGVSISIDDFGTGYTSLMYLKNMPVDELKIDMVFIRNMVHKKNDLAIVRSIIDLCKNLEIVVVAEGVEDIETRNKLCELQCDLAQGYFFARPMVADDLKRKLETGPASWAPYHPVTARDIQLASPSVVSMVKPSAL